MDLLSPGNFREMLIIFGLMLVLLQTVSCVDQICSINQTKPCYTALGDKLSLQMALGPYSQLIIKKENLTCVIKNDITSPKTCDLYNNRTVIIRNGTVIINSVTRVDSGRYTLQLYDLHAKLIPTTGLEVNVEAAIGSVKVSVECISGVRWAYCSSEGDSLIFNWTLNGQPLAQENKTKIDLNGETSGNLICNVKNHISHGEKSTTVNTCPGTTTTSVTTHLNPALTNNTSVVPSLLLIGMGSSIVILIVLVITVCYIYKKKQAKSAPADGGTELVYADINHDKLNRDNKPKKTEMSSAADVEYAEVASQRKTKKKKGKEDEVQYGEVSFTPAGRNVQKQHTEQDECVYSQIYQKK